MSEVLLDVLPLAGFEFACRPDCALCCYAEPLVAPRDKAALLRIVPETEFVARGSFEFVRSSSQGGACRLLRGHLCRAHAARPAPCREYPLAGHIGTRVQATVVLTCPGVDLSPLDGYRGPPSEPPPRGFDEELAALRSRLTGDTGRRLIEAQRRRARIQRRLADQGRWVDEEDARDELRVRLPSFVDAGISPYPPPSEEDGLEFLPLVFDGRNGPVALAARSDGWELLEMQSSGGVGARLGVLPPPRRAGLSPQGQRILQGYLRYWLEREQLFATVHLEMTDNDEGDVTDRVGLEVRRIAATAISRAQVLAALLRGNFGELTGTDVTQGIRATDQDLLDRPTWGSRL